MDDLLKLTNEINNIQEIYNNRSATVTTADKTKISDCKRIKPKTLKNLESEVDFNFQDIIYSDKMMYNVLSLTKLTDK